MRLFWKYLKPYSWSILLTMFLAGLAQVFMLYDPVIFGKILDDYALKPIGNELPIGVIQLLALAVGVGMAALLFTSLKDYVLRMIVQRFGMEIFNEGLRHTLRLPFNEFEDQTSGEILPFC